MKLKLKDLSCGYRTRRVLEGLNLEIGEGEILCILGPNGVGKTTLFKTVLGLLPPLGGQILLNGEDISRLSSRKKARLMGYVPQSHTPPFPYSVEQVVVMGRTAHLGITAAPGKEDYKIAEESLERLGILHLRDRNYADISGGERQMVLIARTLTQQSDIMLMDEPTANLDFGNQTQVLRQISELAQKGMTVVMTTHTPDHAFLCGTRILLLEKDRLTCGTAEEVVTSKNLKRAYGVDVCITEGEMQGVKLQGCVPFIK